jgi:hypothetical protein
MDGGWVILDNPSFTLVEKFEISRAIPLFVLDNAGVKQFEPTTVRARRFYWIMLTPRA